MNVYKTNQHVYTSSKQPCKKCEYCKQVFTPSNLYGDVLDLQPCQGEFILYPELNLVCTECFGILKELEVL